MKRSGLLFTAIAGMAYLMITGYSSGPARGGLGNHTGSGTNNACSGSGCHGANNNSTTITLQLTEQATGQPVTNGKYKPGAAYSVALGGTNAAAQRFGFQVTSVGAGNAQAGLLSSPSANQYDVVDVGTIQVMEHKQRQGAPGSFNIQFNWTAPAAGAGTVTFHSIVNAVNNNFSADAGDHASTVAVSFEEEVITSVKELSRNIQLTAYPNPTSGAVHLTIDNATTGHCMINIIDMTGKRIYTKMVQVSERQPNVVVDANAWAPGLYFAQVIKEGAQHTITVIKQ